MTVRLDRKRLAAIIGLLLISLAGTNGNNEGGGTGALAVSAPVSRSFRGSIGNSHVEMNLVIAGDQLSGTYSYDRIRQAIKLTGQLNKSGGLELKEFDASGKQTGKFVCKGPLGDPLESDCSWSKPNGSGESPVFLTEQHVSFTNSLQITPKVLSNRQKGLDVSYPQMSGGTGPAVIAAENFNRRIGNLVNRAIKEFEPIDPAGHNRFETNYTVLLGTNDLVSVEMYEYSDAGAAHPNDRYWALTWDLAANREVQLEDLFKPGADFKPPIAEYLVAEINKRVERIDREDAKREGREFKPREDPLISVEQLAEPAAFALTPQGLMIYFDFPHVIAVFNKNFVPNSVVAQHLRRVPPYQNR